MSRFIPEKIIAGTNGTYNRVIMYKENSEDKFNQYKIFENKFLSGFRIISDSTDLFGIKVQDPRGFVTRLTMEDFFPILDNCTIEDGEILSKCSYIWSGRILRLISESDPKVNEYLNYKHPVSKKVTDLQFGDTFRFSNSNDRMIYLGEIYSIDVPFSSSIDFIRHTWNGRKLWFKDRYYFDSNRNIQLQIGNRKIFDIERSNKKTKHSLNRTGYEIVKSTKTLSYDDFLKNRKRYVSFTNLIRLNNKLYQFRDNYCLIEVKLEIEGLYDSWMEECNKKNTGFLSKFRKQYGKYISNFYSLTVNENYINYFNSSKRLNPTDVEIIQYEIKSK